jgi:hypothetical protein
MNLITRNGSTIGVAMKIMAAMHFCCCDTVQSQVLFSVELDGPAGLVGDQIFAGNPSTVFGGGFGSGLGIAGDDIDGFHRRETLAEFLFCISVDELSLGGPSPVSSSVLGPFVPEFNVTTEGAIDRQAGNAYLSTEAFTRSGIIGSPVSMGEFNNVLAINESVTNVFPYNMPSSNFGLTPPTTPGVHPMGSTNDVDGGSGPMASGSNLFFTLTDDSPSLSSVGGGAGSGATVYRDSTPDGPGGDESIFGVATDFGLGTGDDIDGLVVFDDDNNGVFSPGDQLLLSLAPGSAALASLNRSAADIFSVTFGGQLEVLASHDMLGLGFNDNLNMLALTPLSGTAAETIVDKVPAPGSVSVVLCSLVAAGRRTKRA